MGPQEILRVNNKDSFYQLYSVKRLWYEKLFEYTKKLLNTPSSKWDDPLGILASNWKDTDEEIEILKLLVDAGADPHKRSSIESKYH